MIQQHKKGPRQSWAVQTLSIILEEHSCQPSFTQSQYFVFCYPSLWPASQAQASCHLVSLGPEAGTPACLRGTLCVGAEGRCNSLVGAMLFVPGAVALAGREAIVRQTASRSSPKSATPSTSDTSEPCCPPLL